MGVPEILSSPIVARLQRSNAPTGSNTAPLFFRPSRVIVRFVSVRYLPEWRVMSVGVHHLIPPFQYDGSLVRGVPPLTISATSPNLIVSHAPSNPGRRVWPVRSCC